VIHWSTATSQQSSDDSCKRLHVVRVEVRAVGLKAMREKRGLTQRSLAHDLGISQNYIPAIEAGARRAGPKLQEQLVKYFGCRFDELFQVVLVDSESGAEKVRRPVEK